MPGAQQRNHAKRFLTKAEEYLASADANLAAERYTPAAGDAIHAGISAKDAIVTALTGATVKRKDHAAAAKELRQALGKRPEAAASERALRELTAAKGDVEYGTELIGSGRAQQLVRRARTLVDLARATVRLGL
jgi:HEPN domain-containing protein